MEYKLEDIFDLQMGKTPSRSNPEYWNSNDHKWISIGDLSRCGKYIEDTKEYLSDKAVEESGISIIPAGTVVMSFKLSIGKTAIIPEPMYSNEAIMSFRDKHVIDILPDYTYYMLSSRDWDTGTNKAVMGKTLNKATLSKIKVKVHGIAEQKEIVRVLDKLNAVIEARQMETQKLEDLIKARFVEMFNNRNYPKVKLGSVCKKITDGTHKTPTYLDEGVTFISAKNIVNGELDFSDIKHISEREYQEIQKRCQTEIGDILLSKSGSLGAPVIVKTEEKLGLFESLAVLKYERDRFLPEFLCEQLKTDAIQRQFSTGTKGVAVKHLHLGVIANTEIIEPPIEEQRAFTSFVKQVDKSKAVIQKSLEEAQLLFDSLMQQYFG